VTSHADFGGELGPILAGITAGGSRPFGHRAHLELAFVAARRHGEEGGATAMCGWIKQIAAAHGSPDRYHETMTIAWARLVAHHVAADPEVRDFGAFAARYPALLDKNLLGAHYSTAALGSAEARARLAGARCTAVSLVNAVGEPSDRP
jgi:hypothetical protein